MSTAEGGGNIVTDGLILCLDAANTKSYVSGSTTWNDLSRGNNNGTLVNEPIFDSANGGSIVFDGVNEYGECTPIQPTFFTLSSWFKATGVPSNNDSTGGTLVVSNPQLFGGSIQYSLFYSWLNQRITGIVQTNNANTIETSDNSVFRNQIYNAVLTYDGSNRNIYINGVLAVSKIYSTNPIYPTTGNINARIGRWGVPEFERYFNGNIYQTSIYNRALTPTEVLQNYNTTKSRYGL
jgi:hypothetical protein